MTKTKTTEQHGNVESIVGGEEEEEGIENEHKTGKREAEQREANAGKHDRTATTQSMHTRFDWADDVDEALGLIPVECNTTQPASVNPAHIPPNNPIPNDVPIDPVRTAFANAAPSSPTTILPVMPTPSPSNNPATPAKPVTTPIIEGMAPSASDSHCPWSLTKHNANGCSKGSSEPPSSSVSPKTAPASSDGPAIQPYPDHAQPKCIVTPQNGDVAPSAHTPEMGAPSDSIPAASVPIKAVHVDPDPVNPGPTITDDCTSAACTPVNHKHVTFMYLIPSDPIAADFNSVASVDTLSTTPTEPVHVDPVLDTFLICQAFMSMFFHFISSSWSKGELEGEFQIANEDVRI
jgi:hypothetical protein